MRKYFWKDKNVNLRLMNNKDKAIIYNSMLDSNLRMPIVHGIDLPANDKRANDMLDEILLSMKDGEEIYFIIENENKIPVGYTVLSWINERAGTCQIDILIFNEYRQKGYASVAFKILLDYIFNERRLHKVHCCTIDGNDIGPKFLFKIGFNLEAIRSEMFYSHGKYLSEYYYGLLEEDYRNGILDERRLESYPSNFLTNIPYSSLGELDPNKTYKKYNLNYDSRKYFWNYEGITLRGMTESDYRINRNILYDSNICRLFDDDVKLPYNLDMELTEHEKEHMNLQGDDRIEFAITNAKDEYLGCVSLCGADYKNGKFSASIYLVPEKRHEGIGSKAMTLLLTYAFFELRMNKFIGCVSTGNVASAKMFRKIGCIVEGVQKHTAFMNGCYGDTIFFGLSKNEFIKKNNILT